MRPALIALPAALALSACVEIDMTLTVLGADRARVTGYMQIDRQIYEMSGQDRSFCAAEDGGTFALTDTHARCNYDRTGSFDEIMRTDSVPNDAELSGTLVALDGDRVRAVIPLSEAGAQMGDVDTDADMRAMMQRMLEGASMRLAVAGKEVISTTGTLSDDGTEAAITLDVDDLFGADAPLQDFETVVRH